jgi:hypothetical protein
MFYTVEGSGEKMAMLDEVLEDVVGLRLLYLYEIGGYNYYGRM